MDSRQVEQGTTRKRRRSSWQMIAVRKLPYSMYVSGDGPFVVLSRCTGPTNRRWHYRLFQTDVEATAALGRINTNGCTHGCQGKQQHSTFRLWPWDKPARTSAKRPEICTPTLALPQGVDAGDVDWS